MNTLINKLIFWYAERKHGDQLPEGGVKRVVYMTEEKYQDFLTFTKQSTIKSAQESNSPIDNQMDITVHVKSAENIVSPIAPDHMLDMDTAPKDGTKIVGWMPLKGYILMTWCDGVWTALQQDNGRFNIHASCRFVWETVDIQPVGWCHKEKLIKN